MENLNYYVLLVFAPLLILVGILGFLIPPGKSLTSGAPAYNIFHIVFGVIGCACVFYIGRDSIKYFNIGFGLIDLYQAVAGFAHLFPEKLFKWKRADDILHILIGAGLVLVGLIAK